VEITLYAIIVAAIFAAVLIIEFEYEKLFRRLYESKSNLEKRS